MPLRFLVDTHIVIRWISDVKKVSREQMRVLETCVSRKELVGVSAITLLEIALLGGEGGRLNGQGGELLEVVKTNPVFAILPLTFDVASEVAALGRSLRDPSDRTIVATARVHGLRLITSDQRIISSKLVQTIE